MGPISAVSILDFDYRNSAYACPVSVSLVPHIIQPLIDLDDKGSKGTQSTWFTLVQCQCVEDRLFESVLEMIYLRGFIPLSFGRGFHELGVVVGSRLVLF